MSLASWFLGCDIKIVGVGLLRLECDFVQLFEAARFRMILPCIIMPSKVADSRCGAALGANVQSWVRWLLAYLVGCCRHGVGFNYGRLWL